METTLNTPLAELVEYYQMALGTGEHAGMVWYRCDKLTDESALDVLKERKPDIVRYLRAASKFRIE